MPCEPDRPLGWIGGYLPVGATDVARLLGQYMRPRLGQPIFVENRPCAGSSLGAKSLVESAADGRMVVSADNSTPIIDSVIYLGLAYRPDRDLKPVGLFAR